ncbi:hypothetical protein V1525DRAFT_350564 [Lipomyces kononenkoae]|uniref:Uncharacterized protein n=1 Tax=Lipomyces kononenkoae TaxID=34357 RepID=A0ACC3SRR1_LIPKO
MARKSVLITGCSDGGIGSALASEFQRRGLHVFATARTMSKMSLLEELPDVTLVSLDVTSCTSISAAVEVIKQATGGSLDYLVNNAGIGYVMPTLDVEITEAKKVFDVNLWGVLAVTQAFAPLVIAAKGSIVNISSVGGAIYPPWLGIYTASKSALTTMTETLRLEMAPFGVNVLTVMSGTVDSNFFRNSPAHRLPSTSRYVSAEKSIAARARGEDIQDGMTGQKYAERVVNDILQGVYGKVWRGKLASVVRYSSIFLPTYILDRLLLKGSGLETFPHQASKLKCGTVQ